MRSPSERLIQTLTASGLCTRAEIDQCEPLVRRLSQDLPDFDSVWLDALVQQNSLTPWQAEQLSSFDASSLVLREDFLLKPLGRHTWLAKSRSREQVSVIRQVPEDRSHNSLQRRLAELVAGISRHRKTVPRSLAVPEEFITNDETSEAVDRQYTSTCFLRSRYIAGWSLDELIVRGGRLPIDVVAEIGRELLAGLAWFESCGLMHGDVTLRNVRIDDRGQVCLADPFVRKISNPHVVISDRLTLRDCEGVAPELVGTGRQPDARSELYALGCVLWQLLTTRPVVLSADPVTRLMKQKEHDVPDVRTWIPDCPEWMARLIQAMTRRTPELRPTSASDALKQWRQFSGSGLSACRRLVATIPERQLSASRSRKKLSGRQRSGRIWPATAAVALSVCVVLAARSGIMPSSLNWDRLAALANSQQKPTDVAPENSLAPTGPQELPAVDADGRIVLKSGVRYIAARRDFPGTLQIVCDSQPSAIIEIASTTPWILSGRTVDLRGLKLTQVSAGTDGNPNTTSSQQLLAVQCATLNLQKCIVQSPSSLTEFVGVEWHRPRGSEGVVTISDSVFAGGGYGLSMNHPPRRLELNNVLISNRGGGLLAEFQKTDAEIWDISLRNVTQRFGFSLLDAIVHNDGIRSLTLNVLSTECAYAPQTAVVRIKTPGNWRSEQIKASFRAAETGNPAVIPPNVIPVVYIDPSLGQAIALPDSQLDEEELLPAELQFNDADASTSANPKTAWDGSRLQDFDGPKLTDRMPGIIPENLPAE